MILLLLHRCFANRCKGNDCTGTRNAFAGLQSRCIVISLVKHLKWYEAVALVVHFKVILNSRIDAYLLFSHKPLTWRSSQSFFAFAVVAHHSSLRVLRPNSRSLNCLSKFFIFIGIKLNVFVSKSLPTVPKYYANSRVSKSVHQRVDARRSESYANTKSHGFSQFQTFSLSLA